jgi:hypothetical protein
LFPKDDPLSLPPLPVLRWTAARKAAVLLALTARVITTAEACRRYGLSEEELAQWFAVFKRYGLPGLRTTRLQRLRSGFALPRQQRRGRPRRPPPDK